MLSAFICRPLGLLVGAGALLAAAETVSVTASATSGIAVGTTVTVRLVLEEPAPLNAFQGYLEWDPAVLYLVSSPSTPLTDINGDSFASAPGFSLATARTAGTGKRSFFTAEGDIAPASPQTLMTWTFSATAPGTAVVRTRQGSVSDDFMKLSDATGTTRYPTVGGSITVTVGGAANQPPTATAQSVTVTEDTAASITLSGSDSDGSIAGYTVLTQPTKGVLTGTAPNLTYT
ncbi:MAG: hypothetical protein RLZZ127_488, partial [Planctomycetota bacterium]